MVLLFPVQPDIINSQVQWSGESPPLYRYFLYRSWDNFKPLYAFIGLNPSKANENFDDPTVRRCINFARREGASRFVMVNVYAYCCTDPKEIKNVADPIGANNDFWLEYYVKEADVVIAAWGTNAKDQGNTVLLKCKGLNAIRCFGTNLDGSPKHPLYIKKNTPLQLLQDKLRP